MTEIVAKIKASGGIQSRMAESSLIVPRKMPSSSAAETETTKDATGQEIEDGDYYKTHARGASVMSDAGIDIIHNNERESSNGTSQTRQKRLMKALVLRAAS